MNKFVFYLNILTIGINNLQFGIGVSFASSTQEIYAIAGYLTNAETSALSSLITAGAFLGCLIVGCGFSAKYGYKNTIIMANLMASTGWSLTLIANCLASMEVSNMVVILMCARILLGMAVGLISISVPSFISEISPASQRGIAGFVGNAFLQFGIFSTYLFSYVFLQNDELRIWKLLIFLPLFNALITFGMLILNTYSCNQPFWILSRLNTDTEPETNRHLISLYKRLYGDDCNVQSFIQNDTATLENINKEMVAIPGILDKIKILVVSIHRKCIFVCLFLMFAQQLTGINVVLFNIGILFGTQSVNISSNEAVITSVQNSVIVGLVFVVAAILSVPVVASFPVKHILAVGSFLCAVCLALISISLNASKESYKLMGKFSVFGYILVFCQSWGPIPWVMMSELFPFHLKGIAGSTVACFSWMSAFIVTIIYFPLQSLISARGVFASMAAITVCFIVPIILYIPETKGRTLEQIHQQLSTESYVPLQQTSDS